MNTKRQTIWLVSILSIMVILSAYYLFTGGQDGDLAGEPGWDQNQDQDYFGPDVNMVGVGSEPTAEGTGQEATSDMSADDAILEQIAQQNMSALDNLVQQQINREEAYEKKSEELMTIITTGESTEAMSQAYEQYSELEGEMAVIAAIEAELLKDYNYAVVSKEEDKWKVSVQTESLEKTQAVNITELMMDELQLAANEIVIHTIQ
ncbi:SpoIIIAH-like family protein [Longirhabdus pacifica]|uniref:SpoIIIAH-like family protein n=1 Tax=Longirhabdus pacifica TaxID=2305227 RepID=UPI001008F97A|nr:SpoIIIAH-like family protein [Longirhabdus pacifica]